MTNQQSVVCADERSERTATPPVDLERWGRLAEAVLDAEAATGELTITFVDIADIAELNEEHMGKTGPTDVLSFPLDEPGDDTANHQHDRVAGVPTLLGDIVICPEVAQDQFVDHAGAFDDEIALLVVHGILHILGHDHAEADEAEVMRARELEHLIALHWGAPAPVGFRQTHD